MKHMKKILPFILILALLAGVCWAYLSDYYRADAAALEAMASSAEVTVETRDGFTLFSPSLPEAGFLFYPGGKVEAAAYAPLMHTLAQKGILCILFEMPGNLAVLDPNAAEGAAQAFPHIQSWYIGGHSLGGSMAATYAGSHSPSLQGLVLLAAYATDDLTDSGLRVLSLYGTEDGVLNREKYEKYRKNLPSDTLEVVIEGGNHAFFGSYGPQEGDGAAAITPEEQTATTAAQIAQFLLD